MLNLMQTHRMYESLGPVGFVRKAFQLLGLEDPKNGHRHVDLQNGTMTLRDQVLAPSQVSIKVLAESLLGYDAEHVLQTPSHKQVDLFEAGESIQPSTFANISAFNSVTAGLLEAAILETWNRSAYLGDRLAQNIPSNKRSEKFIGISALGDSAEERKPGARHPRVGLSERYVTTPDTTNHALGIDVTREAVMFDLTNQLLRQAESVGEQLRLRKEYRIIDAVLGITNTYTYNGTNANTYVASAGNWVNIVGSNALVDWTDVDAALLLFSGMTDQETGQPITLSGYQVLVMPAKDMTANYLFGSTELRRNTATAAETTIGASPLRRFPFELLPSSPFVYKRVLDTDGLALGTTNGPGLWYIGDFKRAFGYVENLPLTISRPQPASDYQMADHGLVFSVFADEMGTPCVLEPRYVVKCKNEA